MFADILRWEGGPSTSKGEHMLVDVYFEKKYSAYICVDVPDDATTEQVEEAAKARLKNSDWMEEYNDILKMEADPQSMILP
jgi:hypothetical protein